MKPKTVILHLIRQIEVLDEEGNHCSEFHNLVTPYTVTDPAAALQMCRDATEFFIEASQRIRIRRRDMEYLLGLRTREMDVAEKIATRGDPLARRRLQRFMKE